MDAKLLKMKQEIDEAKQKKNRMEGELDGIKKSLFDDFGYENIEDAEEAVKDLEAQITKKESEFQVLMKELEEAYDWKSV